MTPQQVLDQILRPAAKALGICTLPHLQLGFGTCGQESRFTNRTQVGGPALGLFQMEPATHDSLWDNFLKYKPALWAATGKGQKPDSRVMLIEPLYAAKMMFIKYLDCPGDIPWDLEGQAAYYKQWYNTPKGAATTEEYLAAWKLFSPGIEWETKDADNPTV